MTCGGDPIASTVSAREQDHHAGRAGGWRPATARQEQARLDSGAWLVGSTTQLYHLIYIYIPNII